MASSAASSHPIAEASEAHSADTGERPGTQRAVSQVLPSRSAPSVTAGSTPAKQSEDLPTPESPVSTTNGWVRSRSITAETSRERPKKRWRCSA